MLTLLDLYVCHCKHRQLKSLFQDGIVLCGGGMTSFSILHSCLVSTHSFEAPTYQPGTVRSADSQKTEIALSLAGKT